MLILIMAAILKNSAAEARVYCQDSHATKYYYLGFSCPVNCNNVVAAVQRLKLLDEQIMRNNIIHHKSRRDSEFDTTIFYETLEAIFENKMAEQEIQNELYQYQENCRLYFHRISSSFNGWNMTKCSRRSYQKQFLEVMTMILNKHVHGTYKFTEEMTALIIDKIIGQSRHHIKQDIKKLLQFLKKALTTHRTVAHAEKITLQSTHCAMMSVPGCYCITGFVEDSGQCVEPTDCLTEEDVKYISRVHIL